MNLEVNRVEKKYIIDPIEAEILKGRLRPYMRMDDHNGDKGYVVRSVYFDSIKNRDYQEKMDGVDNRKKIRLRVYDPNSTTAKLELKEKFNGNQRKRSLIIERDDAIKMLNGEIDVLRNYNDPLAQSIYMVMQMDIYRPKSMVEYDRYAFIIDENDTRITFDSGIRASESNFNLFDERAILTPVTAASEITLEVKYNGFLMSNIKKALSSRMGPQSSNSKYIKSRHVY